MRSLLLVAHGSRRQEANREVELLARQIAGQLIGVNTLSIQRVSTAFLELAEPGIDAALEALVDEGASEIWVMPYFLTNGRHVSEDIPCIIESFHKKLMSGQLGDFQDTPLSIKLLPYLGSDFGMADYLVRWIGRFDHEGSGQKSPLPEKFCLYK